LKTPLMSSAGGRSLCPGPMCENTAVVHGTCLWGAGQRGCAQGLDEVEDVRHEAFAVAGGHEVEEADALKEVIGFIRIGQWMEVVPEPIGEPVQEGEPLDKAGKPIRSEGGRGEVNGSPEMTALAEKVEGEIIDLFPVGWLGLDNLVTKLLFGLSLGGSFNLTPEIAEGHVGIEIRPAGKVPGQRLEEFVYGNFRHGFSFRSLLGIKSEGIRAGDRLQGIDQFDSGEAEP
jgi:hypothetical protein